MKILSVDIDAKEMVVDGRTTPLYGDEAFEILSDLWQQVGWNQKYSYTFTWMGAPIIQAPEDLIRFQEAVVAVRPTVIVETGVARGGSVIYSASLLNLLGGGRVIGVDIDIRRDARERVEGHPLGSAITLIQGSSTAESVVDQVRALIVPDDRVMVVLDSDHSHAHVSAELDAYAPLVSEGSYIIATDGIMRELAETPRGRPEWTHDNPARAAEDFARRNRSFAIEPPRWRFNESTLSKAITYWPQAWLKRVVTG